MMWTIASDIAIDIVVIKHNNDLPILRKVCPRAGKRKGVLESEWLVDHQCVSRPKVRRSAVLVRTTRHDSDRV